MIILGVSFRKRVPDYECPVADGCSVTLDIKNDDSGIVEIIKITENLTFLQVKKSLNNFGIYFNKGWPKPPVLKFYEHQQGIITKESLFYLKMLYTKSINEYQCFNLETIL